MRARGVASAATDLALALDRVEFARTLGVEPDPWQRRVLLSTSKRVLLLCSRQSGKTTTAAIVALHKALYHPGSLILILAPAERQAKESFKEIAGLYRRLGHTIPADEASSQRKLGMVLENGSRIEALPGSEKTIRGFSGVDLLILDEASRIDDGLYYAIRPMLAVSEGTLLMLTTPYGKRGIFFQEWTEGDGWERYEVPANECPRMSADFLTEERKRGERYFAQEFMCQFVETDDAMFSYEDIEAAMTDDVEPLF